MLEIKSLAFSKLKNAEHVSFFTNVGMTIDKFEATKLALPAAQVSAFKALVNVEQDIVNHTTASVFTQEMNRTDEERDRLYRLIRTKLQTARHSGKNSAIQDYVNIIETNILGKYGVEVPTAANQVESALIRGFILDVRTLLPEEALEMLSITSDLEELETNNEAFSNFYHERVTEKSGSTTEATLKARKETEELYNLIALHLKFKANTDTTEVGQTCSAAINNLNVIIKDAQIALAVRMGKITDEDEEEDTPEISPVPFPNGK